MHFASAPSYSTLLTGLDPAQTGKIESTLSAKGIGYQIQNGGTALAVHVEPDGPGADRARVGRPARGRQHAARLRAAQQPAARRLELPAAGHLPARARGSARPDDRADPGHRLGAPSTSSCPTSRTSCSATTRQTSSASVLLSDSGSLDPSAVQGHRRSSSPRASRACRTSKVTITDSTGALLWPASGAGGAGGSGSSQQAAEQQYDRAWRRPDADARPDARRRQGAGAWSNANMNANQTTQDTLDIRQEGRAADPADAGHRDAHRAAAPTAAGTTGTIPAYAAAAGGKLELLEHERDDRSSASTRPSPTSTIAPGAVENQTVSVLVDKSVPASAIAGDQERGRRRRRPERPSAATRCRSSPDRVRQARHHRRLPASTTKMLELWPSTRSSGSARSCSCSSCAATSAGARSETFAASRRGCGSSTLRAPLERALARGDESSDRGQAPAAPVNVPKRQVEELVERDPDRVAQQVRAWMQRGLVQHSDGRRTGKGTHERCRPPLPPRRRPPAQARDQGPQEGGRAARVRWDPSAPPRCSSICATRRSRRCRWRWPSSSASTRSPPPTVLEELAATVEAYDSLMRGRRRLRPRGARAGARPRAGARDHRAALERDRDAAVRVPAPHARPSSSSTFLRNESPQTVALVVANLHTTLAAQVLSHLPGRRAGGDRAADRAHGRDQPGGRQAGRGRDEARSSTASSSRSTRPPAGSSRWRRSSTTPTARPSATCSTR